MAENTENKEVMSARERMLARAQARFPERKFNLPGTESAQSAQNDENVDDLDDAIMEMMEEYAAGKAKNDEYNEKLAALLSSDASSAEFLQRWIETGDPRQAIVETFGDDLGMSDDAKAGFETQLSDWRERKKVNDELNEAAGQNWENSLAELEAWGDEKGLSLEQKRDVMLRLLAITFNGMENKYSREDFDIALSSINHDADVAVARHEGEVQGRNEKIVAARRDRKTAAAMPPATPGGQGGFIREEKPKKNNPWEGIE